MVVKNRKRNSTPMQTFDWTTHIKTNPPTRKFYIEFDEGNLHVRIWHANYVTKDNDGNPILDKFTRRPVEQVGTHISVTIKLNRRKPARYSADSWSHPIDTQLVNATCRHVESTCRGRDLKRAGTILALTRVLHKVSTAYLYLCEPNPELYPKTGDRRMHQEFVNGMIDSEQAEQKRLPTITKEEWSAVKAEIWKRAGVIPRALINESLDLKSLELQMASYFPDEYMTANEIFKKLPLEAKARLPEQSREYFRMLTRRMAKRRIIEREARLNDKNSDQITYYYRNPTSGKTSTDSEISDTTTNTVVV